MPHVDRSLSENLPEDDAYNQVRRDLPVVREMIDAGYTGRKGKGGWYRINREGGSKVKEVRDLKTGEYRPVEKPEGSALAVSK